MQNMSKIQSTKKKTKWQYNVDNSIDNVIEFVVDAK